MDFVVERIVSAKLGPKWVQLCSRLQLRARDRYRIEAAHGNGNTRTMDERYACYVRDTIEEWRSTVSKTDENEAIKHLLCALERVQGFEDVAREIALESGILLHPVTSSPLEPLCTYEDGAETSKLTSSALSLSNPKQISVAANSQPYRWPVPSRAVVVNVNHADPKKQHFIDFSKRIHKLAILDICQRLSSDIWEEFASALMLPSTTIDKLRVEKAVEERYYMMIKGWLGGSKSHTFSELQELLERFNCQDAVSTMQSRLG